MYRVEAIPATELGNASFLVADTDHGVGVVIDPLRDIEGYLAVASDLGIKLTHALDTHLHNDYVSGCRELEAEVGAAIAPLDAPSTRPATPPITSPTCSARMERSAPCSRAGR